MTAKTDPPAPETPPPDSLPTLAARKPRFALFIATVGGLGYFPKAPGTLGSLAGVVLYWGISRTCEVWIQSAARSGAEVLPSASGISFLLECFLAPLVLILGVWASGVAERYSRVTDPQFVVIDEVSGQHLALLLGCALPVWWRASEQWGWTVYTPLGSMSGSSVLHWKYLLLGFLLFRLFDIWKPFPARQAESLPGGWGIMADDWVAGIYAAIGLWLARAAGL
jgi:phosphatidylglycerophosphatase A